MNHSIKGDFSKEQIDTFVHYVGAVCVQHNTMTVEKWVWEIVLHDGASLSANVQLESHDRPNEKTYVVTDRPYDKASLVNRPSVAGPSVVNRSIACTSTAGSVAVAGPITAPSSQISAPAYLSILNEHGMKNGIKFTFQSDCKGPHHARVWHATCFGAL